MTTTNEVELLPCPFCGGKPLWVHHSTRFDGQRLMSLGCCDFRKPGIEADLIAAWNKRVVPSNKDAEGNYTTGDDDLNLLLGLTEDIGAGRANMDVGIWWLETLEKIKARLQPKPQESE